MEVPQYSHLQKTRLQRTLYEHGFNQCFTFPNKSGFYAALAYGLVMHSFPTYTVYSRLMTGKWAETIAGLKAIDNRYSSTHGDQKFYQNTYWDELKTECINLCAKIFEKADPPKPHMVAIVKSGRFIDVSDGASWTHIAS